MPRCPSPLEIWGSAKTSEQCLQPIPLQQGEPTINPSEKEVITALVSQLTHSGHRDMRARYIF